MLLQQSFIRFQSGLQAVKVSETKILFVVLLKIVSVKSHINQPCFTKIVMHSFSMRKNKAIYKILKK